MIKKLYSVYDSAVESYGPPMPFHTKGEALRWWGQACNDATLPMKASPTDYSLFELGEMDDKDASFQLLKAPERIGMAHEFIHKEQ